MPIIKQMGIQVEKYQNWRKVLLETPHTVDWYFKYLRMMGEFRNQSQEIIYIDETWVEITLDVFN